MKLDINDLINAQINSEMWSGYLYLSMSMDAEHKGFRKIAKFFYSEYMHRLERAKKFMDYINSMNKKVYLYTIEDVPLEWPTIKDMFIHISKHEGKISRLISVMFELAEEYNDVTVAEFMSQFVNEQTKTESRIQTFLDTFHDYDKDDEAILLLEEKLGV